MPRYRITGMDGATREVEGTSFELEYDGVLIYAKDNASRMVSSYFRQPVAVETVPDA